jgi:hypothetical protein
MEEAATRHISAKAMTDPYLIAHKVRGEAAFDIAIRQVCVECQSYTSVTDQWYEPKHGPEECSECDGLGYWWIIPTSGHRAYPYWHCDFMDLAIAQGDMEYISVTAEVTDMPIDLPDHYPPRVEPKSPKRSLLAELGLAKPQGHPAIVGKINRRI